MKHVEIGKHSFNLEAVEAMKDEDFKALCDKLKISLDPKKLKSDLISKGKEKYKVESK